MTAPRLAGIQNRTNRTTAWLQRALLAVLGVVVLATAFFFLTLALVVGVVLASIIAIRWWWVVRRLRAANRASEALEGEYIVVGPAEIPDHRRGS